MLSYARALAFCALMSASAVLAQNIGVGLYNHGTFDSKGFDTINMGNLNTHFEIPIVQKAGRGIPFNYSIVYDGLIWSAISSNGTAQWTADSGWGFHGQLNGSALVGYMTYRKGSVACKVGSRIVRVEQDSIYVYHDPFGREHPFDYTGGYSCPNGPDVDPSGSGQARDSSGYRFDGASVYSGDGKAIVPNASASGSGGSVTDANGNTINNNANGTFTDTTGTTAMTFSGGGTASSPLQLTYPVAEQASGATTAAATVYFKTYTVQTNFGCPTGDVAATSVDLVDHISLATNDTYSFTYEPTPNGPGGTVSGRLASITMPTYFLLLLRRHKLHRVPGWYTPGPEPHDDRRGKKLCQSRCFRQCKCLHYNSDG